VTIDLDTTDVELYGRKKRGVACNYQGQRCGRLHVASWAESEVALAADLLAGDQDPRPGAPGLLRRALAALPTGVGEVRLRADGGYFAVDLAVAAHREGVRFAIGAKRIATVWQALVGLSETGWTDATGMPGAQVAVTTYCPAWWPASTRLLIRRVALAPEQISADPRSRRRRTLHPDQRALPLDELAGTDAVYAYSFILTNLDISTPDQAAAIGHGYRHRTTIENGPRRQARGGFASPPLGICRGQYRLDVGHCWPPASQATYTNSPPHPTPTAQGCSAGVCGRAKP
jgi:hypothetical protein